MYCLEFDEKMKKNVCTSYKTTNKIKFTVKQNSLMRSINAIML